MRAIALCSLLLLSPAADAGELRVGAAAVVITPPPGTPMAGYYHARAADGVHDDLHAKTMVLEKDGVAAAIVQLDLISTNRPLVEAARAAVEKATGIPGAHVMIGATHAHTGPVVGQTLRSDAFGGKTDLVARYAAALPGLIAESARRAKERLAPARVAAAVGRVEDLAFNRRFHSRDGVVRWNPGKLNPIVVRPAGPTDPEVPVVVFDATDGRPLATYVNFALHLDTVGGTEISADYPHTLATTLAAVKGPEMVTVFGLGTCGDVNHVDIRHARPQKGHGEATRIGTLLAAEVLRTHARLEPAADGPLRVRAQKVVLALPPVTPAQVAAARKVVDRVRSGAKPAPAFIEQVEAFKVLDVADRRGRPHEVEVQVIALGPDLAWVSLPGEIFVELGLAIKQASPFRQTMINELANGSIGYVPTRTAYPQGAYEVASARCAAGSGEALVDAALGLLRAAHEAPPAATAPSR